MVDPERLFAEHHQRLFRYFWRAVDSAEAARDFTQDVFVRVTRARAPSGTEAAVKARIR